MGLEMEDRVCATSTRNDLLSVADQSLLDGFDAEEMEKVWRS
jgi:hypothetical protein